MTDHDLQSIRRPVTSDTTDEELAAINQVLETLDASARIRWALEYLPGNHIVSSSFGAQSAVMLHLLTQAKPDIPVVLTDTGYLFPETYRFVDELAEQLKLNLKVYRSDISPAWQEARFGRLWEQGIDGIERYNKMNKVEPMQRALKELEAQTWFVPDCVVARRIHVSICPYCSALATSLSCIRLSTGRIKTCIITLKIMACLITHCGSRVMFPLVTGIPPSHYRKG